MSKIEDFGVVLFETARNWRTTLDQRLRPLGLSQAKWLVLARLARSGDGMNQKELSDCLGIEGASLVGLLDRMESDGWVERRVSETDRRAKTIHRTERAVEATREIKRIASQLRNELFSGIPEQQLLDTMALLEQLKQRLQQS
jgi:MarR family transcriptional regulator for hemolysin